MSHRFIEPGHLAEVCARYEIRGNFVEYLQQLEHYRIVVICDDSGSMAAPTENGNTRWSELCQFVSTVFSLTELVQNSPLDLYFLSRGTLLNVQQLQQITDFFREPPKGGTPTVRVLRQVLAQPYDESYRGRIILICTDGEPNDDAGYKDVHRLRTVLTQERGARDYVNFLACTNDDSVVGYLNDWDVKIPRVDVTDDYVSEKKEILRARGRNFHFSYGEYCMKTVLGSVIPAMDKLDEPSYANYGTHTGDCHCIVQ